MNRTRCAAGALAPLVAFLSERLRGGETEPRCVDRFEREVREVEAP